jgi:hypothetical protein
MIRAETVALAEAPPPKLTAGVAESAIRRTPDGAAEAAVAAVESNHSSAANEGTRIPIAAK